MRERDKTPRFVNANADRHTMAGNRSLARNRLYRKAKR